MEIWKKHTGWIVVLTLFCLFLSPTMIIASDSKKGIGEEAVVVLTEEDGQPLIEEVDVVPEHYEPLSMGKLKDFGWRIVNFIALMIILVKFGAKPLGNALSGRRKAIVTEIDELEQRKAEAEKAYKEFQGKLATVEADIDKIVERAVAQAEVEKKKILEKAEAAAEELRRSAEQAVANEVAEARMMLREEVAEKAAVMAEKIIKKNLKATDQKAIIENYLAGVEAIS